MLFLKILILGDGGVGKTTLLHRFVHGAFIDTATMTIGAQVQSKELEIDAEICQLLIFDVSGQERFRYMVEEFLKGANGALILFDIKHPPLSSIRLQLDYVNNQYLIKRLS